MSTTLTSKGQVTVPKHVRESMQLLPGMAVEFTVNGAGEVVLRQAQVSRAKRDRFDAARGGADVRWRTKDLMQLLRPED